MPATPPQPVEAPAAAAAKTHVVKSGETLDGIARQNDISVEALRRANQNVSPRRLQIGQKLKIPR